MTPVMDSKQLMPVYNRSWLSLECSSHFCPFCHHSPGQWFGNCSEWWAIRNSSRTFVWEKATDSGASAAHSFALRCFVIDNNKGRWISHPDFISETVYQHGPFCQWLRAVFFFFLKTTKSLPHFKNDINKNILKLEIIIIWKITTAGQTILCCG